MLTEKENYLRTLAGEEPEWVPVCGPKFGSRIPDASRFFEPPLLNPHHTPNGRVDLWGVHYVATDSAEFALIPDHNFILSLEALPHWQDVIKIPDFSGVNWEKLVTDQLAQSGIDRSQTALSLSLHFGYFQTLMALMGFENGLIAFYEYPDAVHELLTSLSDFYMDVADKVFDLYQPDTLTMFDDTASWNAPFISAEMYRDFILPHHEKFARRGRERNLPMLMHNCGKCESVLEMLSEIGIIGWESAQTCNDLDGIKAKFGNSMVILGAWDTRDRLLDPLQDAQHPDGVSEEELRQSVRDTLDRYAVGGGFCWLGVFLEAIGDNQNHKKNEIIINEAETYGKTFYRNTTI